MKHFVFFQLLLLVAFQLRGEAVCDQNSRGTALIVIDMQPGFVTRGGNHEDSKNKQKVESIIGEQTKLIERARSANLPIIFLEYEGNFGETSSTLKQAVEGYSDVKIFKKNTDGMLDDQNRHRSDLISYLKQKGIGNMIITGANGGACVRESISGSLTRGCSVVAFSPGIADFNYQAFIYPYKGKYSDIKRNCKKCTFKEVVTSQGIHGVISRAQQQGSDRVGKLSVRGSQADQFPSVKSSTIKTGVSNVTK